MKSVILTLVICLVSITAHAEEGFHRFKNPGYDQNPLIPGSKWKIHDNDRPTPPRVIPGSYVEQGVKAAPEDAEILFDGTSLENFWNNEWILKDGYVVAGKGGLTSRKAYGDCQLHIEWRTPDPSVAIKNARMGNSGIYFMGRYELQIFDSYSCEIYPDGSAAALYGQTPPLFNVSRKPGEWQTFDIHFKAPVFEDNKLVSPASMTVLHNGVFVQINTELTGPTSHNKPELYSPHKPRLAFFLQGGKSPVEYRNIWIRDLSLKE
ncbi:DUF1080 domain-containing protein [Rubellicoccus peritrichatus]|uniref:DUF1080 domain-containing protein n=1 Tax=Rubellicoccus peritrichatus TaxID=3080537 RepID=A0AAQ3QTM3_9BACT|nr:DUF1080 domain-containing protein [Puniceicoccus sp. CR14]WOO41476.1 DUF1080 domain-containing protein [Puniceicoccus sp. CR14]